MTDKNSSGDDAGDVTTEAQIIKELCEKRSERKAAGLKTDELDIIQSAAEACDEVRFTEADSLAFRTDWGLRVE